MTSVIPLAPCVYGLFDRSEPERCRYVGLTRKGAAFRLRGHWKEADRGRAKRPVLFWLRKRTKADVEVRVLEYAADDDHMMLLERFWIAQMRGLGQADLNLADGGEGSAGWHHSQEFKDAMAIRTAGAGSPTFGVGHTDETRALMSIAAQARTGDPEWRRQHGDKVRLAWESPDLRLRQSLGRSTLTAENVLEIRRLRDVEGMFYDDIVDVMGIPTLNPRMVGMICRRECWDIVPAEQPRSAMRGTAGRTATAATRQKLSEAHAGSKHWKTSLTEVQVEAIKREIWMGLPHTAIASGWGLGKQAVSHISKGASWTAVPWPIGPRATSKIRRMATPAEKCAMMSVGE